ncbi:hypothetical protein WN944_026249 [Citrus x changshan-huyou]|uniref:Uncharacterized protein n=1 Tax=Citrus x changshan-huyou TaxID=2935761 RepID=A0AAP0LVX8_9ROSI
MEEVKLHGFWASPLGHRVMGIEETWPENPLLPTDDNYERATARFQLRSFEQTRQL